MKSIVCLLGSAVMVTSATARADGDGNALLSAMVYGEHYDTRIDAVFGVMAPFGAVGGEGAFHSTGFLLPGLLLEARAGVAVVGATGEWGRGKVGFALRRFHGPTKDDPSDRLGRGDVAGVTEHALYVPLEVFHLAIKDKPSQSFFNTGIGYRYTRSTSSDHWYLIDAELDYRKGAGMNQDGVGGLVAVEYGKVHLFARLEVGVFAGQNADFGSTFRLIAALGWHFNMNLGSSNIVPTTDFSK